MLLELVRFGVRELPGHSPTLGGLRRSNEDHSGQRRAPRADGSLTREVSPGPTRSGPHRARFGSRPRCRCRSRGGWGDDRRQDSSRVRAPTGRLPVGLLEDLHWHCLEPDAAGVPEVVWDLIPHRISVAAPGLPRKPLVPP